MRSSALATLLTASAFLFGSGISIQASDATQATHRAVPKELTEKVEAKVLGDMASKGKATFWVMLKDKADLQPAFSMKNDAARGTFVYEALKNLADRTQTGLRSLLKTAGATYHPFWIVNSIQVVNGKNGLLTELTLRPEVEKIVADRSYELLKPTPDMREVLDSIEWNIDNIQASLVWSTFGVRGEGIVVANMDSGVQFDHPALVAKYRGNLGGGNFDHNHNWYDPSLVCRNPSNVPCDNTGHGTHTMGIMVGDDGDPGPNQIGVAPHAQFISCKACESESCSLFALNTCAQFYLAPWDLNGNNPDPSLRPHIINNSWGGGPGDSFFQAQVDAWVASGIFPAFAAGNTGPNCGTVTSPGDYLNTYAVGSYNIDNTIRPASGRGPSAFNPDLIKPNIAAPGGNIRSAFPRDTYAVLSGTSMATPHVAGTVALMWSAAPSLVRNIDATRAILDSSAADMSDLTCGGTPDNNNVWGQGRLNAFQAVSQSPVCGLGNLSGAVSDSTTGNPIPGALVHAVGLLDRIVTTDSSGNYSMQLCEGSYDVAATAFGYMPGAANGIAISAGNTTNQNFALNPAQVSTVSGMVTDGSGHGWPLYARIDIDGYPNGAVFTNPFTGAYSVNLPQDNTFIFHVNKVSPGYITGQRDVVPGANLTEDFTLLVDNEACIAPGYAYTASSTIFSDGFEGGFGNWTMTGLWNPESQSDSCGSLIAPFPSPTNAAYYGIDNVCTYNNGSANTGSLTMASPVSIPAAGITTLSFYSYEKTECDIFGDCDYDNRHIEVSTDGGSTWAQSGKAANESAWYQKSLDLTAFSGQNVLVRFRFDTGDSFYNDFFGWMIDNVDISAKQCVPVPGGLLVGNVYDSSTGNALNGATVTSDEQPGDTTTTFSTPDDPNVDEGFYMQFSSLTGAHNFTASMNLYGPDTESANVPADNVVAQNFNLGVGHLVATPVALEDTLNLGAQDTQQLTITNDGNADATFQISEGNGLASFRNPNLPKAQSHGVDHKRETRKSQKWHAGAPAPAHTSSPQNWNPGSPMPVPTFRYGHAQCAESPESFYVISGTDQSFQVTNATWRYDSETDTWTSLAPVPAVNFFLLPSAVCFEGRIYVAVLTFTGNGFFIYDIATDTWLVGAGLPRNVDGAAAGALNGKVYLIGGDDGSGFASHEVDIYDIATDTWTGTGAPMPTATSNAGFVQVGQFVYVVGGHDLSFPPPNSGINQTQRYEMSADRWEVGPIFDSARDEFALSATDAALYAIGGSGSFGIPTSLVERLDLNSWPGGAWVDLSDPLPVALSGNSAGFCTTSVSGGEVWSTSGLTSTAIVNGVNQYRTTGEGCAGNPDVRWLSENPVSVTVPAGGQIVVDITYDAGQVSQPGDYFAHLTISSDTPYPAQVVSVTMHVNAPNFGTLNGAVNGMGRCDAAGSAIDGATVFVDGPLEDYTLTTNASGNYTRSFDAANSPVNITVSAPGYVTQTLTGVILVAGQITTEDFALRMDAPCAGESPASFDVTLRQNQTTTVPLTLTNAGAGSLNFTVLETAFALPPQVHAGPIFTDVPWVSEAPTSGTVAAASNTTINVTFDATGLAPGDYAATLVVTSNDAGAAQFNIPLTLHVSACTLCEEFNDTTPPTGWTYSKTFTESGGSLHVNTEKKSTAVANPVFAGCSTCSVATSFTKATTNGVVWVYAWRTDAKNQIEFQIKKTKVILKQRVNNAIKKKASAALTLTPNAPHAVTLSFDGANVVANVDGTDIITGFAPVGGLGTGTVGLGNKGDLSSTFDYVHVN